MSNVPDEKLHFIKCQELDLSQLSLLGSILDIGGGGEGIIGQIFKESVIAIDPSKRELEESSEGPLKIVMDAKDLQFLDNTFDYVSSFFTLMYISKKDHRQVLEEVYRVLKKGGEFILWDVTIGAQDDPAKEYFVMPLKVNLGNEIIETGYGVEWVSRNQDLDYYIDLVREIGFQIIEKHRVDLTYKLVLRK